MKGTLIAPTSEENFETTSLGGEGAFWNTSQTTDGMINAVCKANAIT